MRGATAASTSSTTASPPTATTATTTTGTYTVVGTTPFGNTVTETSTQVTTTPAGPNGLALETGAPIGAQTSTTITGQTIDGVQCSQLTQLAYTASAHLQIDVHGHPRALPGTIGLVGAKATSTGTVTTYAQGLCSYWLSTTAADGVIAVRSAVHRTYTLGQFFDVWGEPLSAHRVAGARGRVTARINGRRWHGDPRGIPLREHEAIQLAVGRPVPAFRPVDWTATDL